MPEYTLNINIEGGSGSSSEAKRILDKVNNKSNVAKDVATSVMHGKPPSGKSFKTLSQAIGTPAAASVGVAAGIVNVGTTVAKYKLSHYGERYSYQARQNQINNIIGTTTSTITAMTGVGAAFALGGPVVGAIAAATTVIDMSYKLYEHNQEWNRKNHEYEIEQSRTSERLGLLASDRNRGR